MLKRHSDNPEVLIDIDLAMVYLGLNQVEKALDHLEIELSKGQGSLFIKKIFFFNSLIGNQRFEEMKRTYTLAD